MEKPIEIKVVNENQSKLLRPIMREGFGLIGNLMAYDVGKHTLVAYQGDHILGGIVCGVIRVNKKETLGIVKYIFTSKKARGLGVASKLLKEALNYFKSQNYQEVVACIEGYNTASSYVFTKFGFKIKDTRSQLKQFKHKLPLVWLKGKHIVDFGHFWWVKSLHDEPVKESRKEILKPFITHTVLNALLPILLIFRVSGFLSYVQLIMAFLAIVLVFLLRFVPMFIYSKVKKYPLYYKGFESGYTLSLLITMILGGIFLSYGGVYPKKEVWKEIEERRHLAPMHLASVSTMVLSSILIVLFNYLFTFTPPYEYLMKVLLIYIPFMTFIDLLFAFFPVNSLSGGRIVKSYPKLWGLLIVISLSTLIVSYMV